MIASSKIIAFEDLAAWRGSLERNRLPLVATNGCFDILHVGHAQTLAGARGLGAALLVGITGDAGVRLLKGMGRPVVGEQDRAELIAALEAVDFVCVFPQADAVEFLRRAQPNVYVKGGGYSLETINQDERELLTAMRARIEFLPLRGGRSSSWVIEKLKGSSAQQSPEPSRCPTNQEEASRGPQQEQRSLPPPEGGEPRRFARA